MTWEVPDRSEDHHPEGGCSCVRDLADAADLGVARSYQQEEIPSAPAERVQHDLNESRCACGRVHVAARPAGVPDSALSIGPRLRALAVYLVVFQHVPVGAVPTADRRRHRRGLAGAGAADAARHDPCLARRPRAGTPRHPRRHPEATGARVPACRPGRPGQRSPCARAEEQHEAAAGRELLEFCRNRRDDVLRFTTDTSIWPTKTTTTSISCSPRSVTPPGAESSLANQGQSSGRAIRDGRLRGVTSNWSGWCGTPSDGASLGSAPPTPDGTNQQGMGQPENSRRQNPSSPVPVEDLAQLITRHRGLHLTGVATTSGSRGISDLCMLYPDEVSSAYVETPYPAYDYRYST
jgi:hypothetical protein